MTTGQRTLLYLLFLVSIMAYMVLSSAPPLTLLIVFLVLMAIPFALSIALVILAAASSGKNTEPDTGPTVPLVNKTLIRVQAFFPFDFFPDMLIVNEADIVIVQKTFFFTGWTETVPVNEIKRVVLFKGPFFSSLTVELKSKEKLTIGYLRRADAYAAKEIIDGLILKQEGRVTIPKHTDVSVEREILRQAGKSPAAEKETLEKPL